MKTGLKLWSTNTDQYYNEAQKLHEQEYFDYIELYVVPNSETELPKWRKLDIPFILHAPHFKHRINLADPDKLAYNTEILSQVERYRKELNADYTIVHLGMNGTIEESIRQLQKINPQNYLIENKPYIPPFNQEKKCRGSTVEEIRTALSQLPCGFCLDIGHAICTANFLNLEPYAYLAEFQKLNPQMLHLSDGNIASALDQHLHFSEGNYDIKKIFSIVNPSLPISIETKKDFHNSLDDFIHDIMYIKNILNK